MRTLNVDAFMMPVCLRFKGLGIRRLVNVSTLRQQQFPTGHNATIGNNSTKNSVKKRQQVLDAVLGNETSTKKERGRNPPWMFRMCAENDFSFLLTIFITTDKTVFGRGCLSYFEVCRGGYAPHLHGTVT